MKRVYLDNNVFVDIEMGKLRAEQFLQKQSCTYYFSEAHINELLEAKDNFRVSQEGRLKLISKLCGRNNILTGALEGPELFEKTPEEMYRICDIPFRNRVIQNVNSGDDLFLELRRKLDFDNSVFNNVCPSQVLKMIDEKLKYKIGISLNLMTGKDYLAFLNIAGAVCSILALMLTSSQNVTMAIVIESLVAVVLFIATAGT